MADEETRRAGSGSGNAAVRVVLFIRLREGLKLDEDLENRIRRSVRDNATPRHVPAKIIHLRVLNSLSDNAPQNGEPKIIPTFKSRMRLPVVNAEYPMTSIRYGPAHRA